MIAAATTLSTIDDPLSDPIVRRIVGRKVAGLVRRRAIAAQDAEDVEHDLLLFLHQRWSAFDSNRSHPYSFATMLTARAAANVLRDRRAEKRDPAKAKPLVVDAAGDDGDLAHVDLTTDVAAVIALLPTDLQLLAERLKDSSVSQVARNTNVGRTAVYREVHKLRRLFEQAGLDDIVW
jgi:DNA-directed RNA polymerase specialized sigma24 family protein